MTIREQILIIETALKVFEQKGKPNPLEGIQGEEHFASCLIKATLKIFPSFHTIDIESGAISLAETMEHTRS